MGKKARPWTPQRVECMKDNLDLLLEGHCLDPAILDTLVAMGLEPDTPPDIKGDIGRVVERFGRNRSSVGQKELPLLPR